MTVYALGLLIIVGLILVAWRIAKGTGFREAELDATLARLDAIEKAAEEAKQNEKTVTNLTDDELIDRLSK